MAIEIDLRNTQFGVPFNGAYFRILHAGISRHDMLGHVVQIDVAGYAVKPENESSRDIDFRRYYAAISEIDSNVGEGFLAKCYAWIMSQPDMQGAVAA